MFNSSRPFAERPSFMASSFLWVRRRPSSPAAILESAVANLRSSVTKVLLTILKRVSSSRLSHSRIHSSALSSIRPEAEFTFWYSKCFQALNWLPLGKAGNFISVASFWWFAFCVQSFFGGV